MLPRKAQPDGALSVEAEGMLCGALYRSSIVSIFGFYLNLVFGMVSTIMVFL